MNNKLTIIVVSRKSKEEKEEFLTNIQETCGVEYDLNFIQNIDNLSLTTLYNQAIESSNTEYLVFCHDDIEFKNKGWGKEIIGLFERNQDYGIIGVAGSKQFDDNSAWWMYPKKAGQVMHKANGKTWLTCFSDFFDHDLEQVCVIDGLFMAISKSRISKRFDEEFQGFDHYDTSFCLANYIDGKTKIGVTMKVRLIHESVGDMSPNWFTNRSQLSIKYHKYYPIDLKK